MFEFAVVIESLERNFSVIFKICFRKKIGENAYEFGTKNRKNTLISTIIHSCALVLEKMLKMLKFCCILYFPQLPFDSSSSWKYWALRDPVLKAGWDASPYSRYLLLWCYFVGFCFLSQNWWKVCNAAKTMGKCSPVVVLDFPLILFILPST